MRTMELDLDVYQGPFDLLCTLILKEEVDICEVSLLEVILAYLQQAAGCDAPDWEGLTEFLVLVSGLLELKSRILLPLPQEQPEDLGAEEARELLLTRLLTYRQFKGASEALLARFHEQRGRMLRPPDRTRRRVPPAAEAVAGSRDPAALARIFAVIVAHGSGPDTSHVARTQVDLARQIAAVRRLLAEHGRLSFDEAFGQEGPMIQAVTLFALLELLADGDVRVAQRRPFADIMVERREPASRSGGGAGRRAAAGDRHERRSA